MENIILMIDQQVDESRKLKVNLENNGYRVLITKSVEEALSMISANNIDLIIIFDIIDIAKLRTNDKSKDIPIMGVLDDYVKDKAKNIDKYLDDYIFVPYEKEQLFLKIKNQIKIKKLQDTVKQKELELEKAYDQLNNFGLIDKVTGLYNNYYFEHILQNQTISAERYGYQLSGMIIAVDNKPSDMKIFDEILKEVANIIKNNIRANDILVRLNAEELFILLPHTGLKDAVFVGEKLRKIVNEHKFKSGNVTISIGVAVLDKIDKGIRKDKELVLNAKEALKNAINEGGNKVKHF